MRIAAFGIVAAQLGACASLEQTVVDRDALRGSVALAAAPAVLSPAEERERLSYAEPVRDAAFSLGEQADEAPAVLSPAEERERLATGGPMRVAAISPSITPSVPGPAIQGEPLLSAPESAPSHAALVQEGDPLEDINRHIFHFNEVLDSHVVEPTARAYQRVLPREVRQSVRNVFANLESPVTFTNDVLQGEWDRAHITLTRFAINSTIGIAGLHDRAAEMGYEAHSEDFAQTLAVYGVPSGPYLMVPLIGPSTPRHLAGRVVDSLAHPLTWMLAGEPLATRLAPRALELVAARAELLATIEQVRATSPDYYATVRNTYRQNRDSEITNGNGGLAGNGIILDDEIDY